MIRYDRGSKFVPLYWWGGLNRHLVLPAILYAIFLVVVYYVRAHGYTIHLGIEQEEESGSLNRAMAPIISFTVFLFVFRLNQAMARHNEGADRMTSLFEHLEQAQQLFCTLLTGGPGSRNMNTVGKMVDPLFKDPTDRLTREELLMRDDKFDEIACACRVHFVRLTISFAITFLMHCHLVSATVENDGVLDDEAMIFLVYLYSRLRMLLYAHELKCVDDSLDINATIAEDGQREFRVSSNRHQVDHVNIGIPVIGSVIESNGTYQNMPGKVIYPVYRIIYMMMVDLIQLPADQPWGMTQRQMAPIMAHIEGAMVHIAHMDHIMNSPVSLAYFQHCRVLLLIFGLFYPFSCDPSTGPVENVLIPCLGLWAIMGLEKLADIMENPFGTDDTDLDSMRHLHTLEVVASRAWQHSETYREGNRQAQIQILRKSTLGTATDLQQEHLTRRKPGFESFFTWKPIPSLIVQESMEKHGHVDIKHRMALDGDMQSSLRRTWRRVVRGRGYQDVAKSFMSCCTDAEWATDFMKMDPNIFAHYLVFNDIFGVDPVTGEECEEARSFNLWRMRCFKLLGQDHEAISLLDVNCPMDSERSVMGPRVWWTRQETGSMGSLASKGMMDTDPLLQDASIMTGGAGPLPGSSLETASTDVSPDPGRLHGAPRKLSPVDLLGALGDQLEGQSVIAGQRNGDMQMQAPPLPAYPVSATSEGGKGIDLALAASGLPTNYC
mmetsp:Transcript_42551/g.126227  ORF Transcript_42551/g.126227 Transcript_42551/m.126227 type:complete len:721 (-) Transcript_42551:96-2258(-)